MEWYGLGEVWSGMEWYMNGTVQPFEIENGTVEPFEIDPFENCLK